jgi:class 3 adenylate cyclase
MDFDPPQTRYARSGGVSIAYQVIGDGPFDLVFVPGWVSHVEHVWELPSAARFLRRLASFSRLIMFDKRGTGLSDPGAMNDVPTLEERLDDTRAVMDAAGSERAALLACSEGGAAAGAFAAIYPQRTIALAIYAGAAKASWSEDYPIGFRPEQVEFLASYIEQKWGSGEGAAVRAPSVADDPAFLEWFARYERLGASPGAAAQLLRINLSGDLRDAMRSIDVPTLLLHRRGDLVISVETSRHLHRLIRGSRLVELDGNDHFPWIGDADAVLTELGAFLGGANTGRDCDRAPATIMFTDIVDSTSRLAELGDRRWTRTLEDHQKVVRRAVHDYRGREIKTAGDGFLVAFEEAESATRCAQSMVAAVRDLGIRLRVGLHAGECELVGRDVAGMTVHVASRVLDRARSDEVLVTQSVRNLIDRRRMAFTPRGEHRLKGVPGVWPLYALR